MSFSTVSVCWAFSVWEREKVTMAVGVAGGRTSLLPHQWPVHPRNFPQCPVASSGRDWISPGLEAARPHPAQESKGSRGSKQACRCRVCCWRVICCRWANICCSSRYQLKNCSGSLQISSGGGVGDGGRGRVWCGQVNSHFVVGVIFYRVVSFDGVVVWRCRSVCGGECVCLCWCMCGMWLCDYARTTRSRILRKVVSS